MACEPEADVFPLFSKPEKQLLGQQGRKECTFSCRTPGLMGTLFADALLYLFVLFAAPVCFFRRRRARILRSCGRADKFRERKVRKRYVAMVHGVVSADEGEIDLPLCRNRGCPPLHMVNYEHGKPSLTLW